MFKIIIRLELCTHFYKLFVNVIRGNEERDLSGRHEVGELKYEL